MPTPLKSILLETIRSNGPITFERYMHECLYHPQFGYYTQGPARTGREGDYFTSPDLHPIYAHLIARQAAEIWDQMGKPKLFIWVEMGAGRGLFALDFLDWIRRKRADFLAALDYFVVEPGELARRRIAAQLAEHGFGTQTHLCASLDAVPQVTGCFFSNELVDAFPVAVVVRSKGRLREIYVDAEGDALVEKTGPISRSEVAVAAAKYAHSVEEGQRVEVNLTAALWMQAVAAKLDRGVVITSDYGDLAERLYTPERPEGTLLAYFRHAAIRDFFAAPGEMDLTAHVNFSALMDAGREAGCEPLGFTTQEKFLMALGEETAFADLEDSSQSATEKLQARLKLKRLIYPGGMGTIFKVLVQQRGLDGIKLAGLKYVEP